MPSDTNASDKSSAKSIEDILFGDMSNVFDIPLLPAMLAHHVNPFYYDMSWEPPYARVLRRLGLFDPIELPKDQRELVRSKRHAGTFPVVSYSARNIREQDPFSTAPDQQSQRRSEAWQQEQIDRIRDQGGQLIGTIGEVFGDTSRWAVGNLFGQLRNAMDHIEGKMNRNVPEDRDGANSTQSLYSALRNDLVTNFDRLFPEPNDSEQGECRYYHISSYTMPDGSVETRKVVRNRDGTETTTITKHSSDPAIEDRVTTTTTSPQGSLEEGSSSKK
ncbi:hypothetical protein GGI07_001047 [Coemansia sp. Benny D115]|nr:hypothetical protein GGI07_001047 [Coemansia sp. Benny D115]